MHPASQVRSQAEFEAKWAEWEAEIMPKYFHDWKPSILSPINQEEQYNTLAASYRSRQAEEFHHHNEPGREG